MIKPPIIFIDDITAYRAEDVPDEYLSAIAKELSMTEDQIMARKSVIWSRQKELEALIDPLDAELQNLIVEDRKLTIKLHSMIHGVSHHQAHKGWDVV